MPQISEREFEVLPLRVHAFLADVPLHDVWAVDSAAGALRIRLDEFLRTASARPCTSPPLVRALLNIRLFVGRCATRIAAENTRPTAMGLLVRRSATAATTKIVSGTTITASISADSTPFKVAAGKITSNMCTRPNAAIGFRWFECKFYFRATTAMCTGSSFAGSTILSSSRL